MKSKPLLMIHEMREWMFDLPLHEYTLTFDDGLFSQYYYLDKLKAIDTEKIFFISTNITCEEEVEQDKSFPTCDEAHELFFGNGIRNNYMKWSQIEEIHSTPNCTIGGHSHNHNHYYWYQKIGIKELYNGLIEDTALMFKEFNQRNITITKFCFPYNEKFIFYEGILKKNNIIDFYGEERIAIEKLR